MTIQRINHLMITIPVGSEADARAFYCGVLGLREIDKPESLRGRGGLWLELDGQQIHLGAQDGIDRRASRAHVAFQVDDLPMWQAKLTAHGVEIGDSIPIPGYNRFEFRDPFGNRLELMQAVE